jgi:hypothetical protein
VRALSRDILDHTPLLLDIGHAPTSGSQPLFKFELGWLLRDGFGDMVKEIWESLDDEEDSMIRWQLKIRRMHQHLRGWAKNVSRVNKEEKESLDKLDELDKRAEAGLLSTQERDLKECLHSRLSQLLREEEIKWYQRSKAKNLLEGDSNTKYFQLLANGRHKKSHIFQLQDGSQNISGDIKLKKYITSYYRGLFRPPQEQAVRLDGSHREDIP